MAEPGTPTASWAERMELLKDSAQQRVLSAPMPTTAMEQLLADKKALALGSFADSPVHYLGRWWRPSEEGWLALDEDASSQLALHAERYRTATTAAQAAGADGTAATHVEGAGSVPADQVLPSAHPEAGAA